MKAEERRKQILEFFRGQSGPVSASALADRFSVSRQIIVGDVALLRASGMNIEATPRGYILTEEQKKGILRRVACTHNREQMEDELNICVDYGCEVLNVIVEHPVYGQLTGELHLQSRYDVAQFVEKVRREDAHSLSELTDGTHLHTLCCPTEELFHKVCEALEKAGYLLEG